jgi:putative transcription antitermination factor YqgF
MTYLGVDFGLRKISLAISDGAWPAPLPVLTYHSSDEVLEQIVRLCSENGIEKIIFGLPQPDKIGARKFGEKLATLAGAQIEFVDQPLTTQEAATQLKGKSKKTKGKESSLAASRLLGNYLDCC